VFSIQQFSEMLYGFYEYLIMVKDKADLTVIVPQGEVKMSETQVVIKSTAPEVIDEITTTPRSYNKFTIHSKFKHLHAMDVLSGLQLAAIQACTGSSLPEQGTGVTGHEMAIEQIRKCWINRPLDSSELLMVESLLSLNNLPSALVILVHQLVKNSFQLSFLYQSAAVEKKMNINNFVKAVNDYHLPLQNHLSFRNYRLSLTSGELRLCLGTQKPTSYFHAIKSQLESFFSYRAALKKSKGYLRRKDDISNYELQLNNLTNATISKKAPFPLQNLPLFQNKEIGNQILNGLNQSYKQHVMIPKSNLCHGTEMTKQEVTYIHNAVKKDKEELFRLLNEKIHVIHDKESVLSDAIHIHRAANAIPILTLYDIIRALWQPQILRHFNPMLTENDIDEVKDIITDWVQFCVLDDKIIRISKHLSSNAIDFAIQELQARRTYNPYDYPQWLAFEYDQGLQIRPEQGIIIDGILNGKDSVAQLNMGLGKTRVIVPCLILELSRRKKIPRVYFLSSLLDEGFDYLRNTLTNGVFTKKLFRFPFNRDVKLTIEHASVLIASLKHCESSEGSVILAPEHSLSLILKGFELEAYGDTMKIPEKIREAETLPFADIYDEVDEMMLPNQELIYAEGSPIPLKSGPCRWGAVFSLLFMLRHHIKLDLFKRMGCATFESDSCPIDEFNRFQLLPGKQLQKQLRTFLDEITNSLFSTKVRSPSFSTLNWMREIKSEKFKDRIKEFIINPCTPANTINESELLHQDHFQDLLVLRGLLGYEILIHCLKLRHNIDYGVVANHKTLMAIPFRAANLPKLRSEFAQPDCSVVFTVLSYYNIGLTRDQVMDTFTSLLSCGPSFQQQVYKEIFELREKSNKKETNILQSINLVDKLDLANEEQVDLLYHLYRKNMLLINFWLGYVLFPTATMVFPGKLMASSWNLTDSRTSHLRCGFSGTDDACILLPYPLVYQPPDAPSLKATNGKMLEYLMKKATFCSISIQPGEDIESVLADMALEKDVDALIDAGALLNNHPIEKVADIFLARLCRAQGKFKGVVYFCVKRVCWCIKDMKQRETRLSSSPIAECDAFVIYDQSRCRGADMKLRPNAKAFLSIGPRQQKDSLMQAAGRLRQLDFGQTIIAIATPDIELLMKDCLGIPSIQKITMEHVLSFVLYNSVDAIGNSLKYWSSQGLHFLQFVHDSRNVRGDEKYDLETLYSASDKTCTVSEIVLPKLGSIEASYCNSCKTSSAIVKVIREQTKALGVDVVTNFVVNFDECERELEQEREMENEKEKELPLMHPFNESDWDYHGIFSIDSPSEMKDLGGPMTVEKFIKGFLSHQPALSIKWKATKIFLTSNFIRPLIENPPYDDFLRPLRFLLYFPQHKEFLAVSEREADKIWRCFLERSFDQISGGPILCSINFLLSEEYDSSPLDSLVSLPGEIPAVTHAALTLLNGQTAFCQQDQEALKYTLLQSREAASAASFFCIHRGFRVMLHGSDLEKTCNQIYRMLHEQDCDFSLDKE